MEPVIILGDEGASEKRLVVRPERKVQRTQTQTRQTQTRQTETDIESRRKAGRLQRLRALGKR